MISMAPKDHRVDGGASPREEPLSVLAIEGRDALERFLPEWEDLAQCALEPNVFYEPWMLMPALESYGSGSELIFVLVFAGMTPSAGCPTLCGFFPLERTARYKGLPVSALTLWRYVHCYLCSPLLRRGYAAQVLDTFLAWLRESREGSPLMEFGHVAADGPSGELLGSALSNGAASHFVYGRFTRAFLKRGQECESYLRTALSRKARKELRRVERRLAEVGHVEYASLEPDDELNVWLEEFLRLEAAGWKGQARSAMACTEQDRDFFVKITREALRRERLMMLALRLDGRPIAVKCNLLAGDGAFAFKIAFDESYRRFSPGVLLEVENIRRLRRSPPGRWMDTCAVSDHVMANRLFVDRREIQTVLVTTGRPLGDLLVGAMPILRWISRRLPRRGAATAARRS